MNKFLEAAKLLEALSTEFPGNELVEAERLWLDSQRLPYQVALDKVREFKAKFPLSGNGPMVEANLHLRFGRASAALKVLDAMTHRGASEAEVKDTRQEALEVAARLNGIDPPIEGPNSLDELRKRFAREPPKTAHEIERAFEDLKAHGERLTNAEYHRAHWYRSRGMTQLAIPGLREAVMQSPNSGVLSQLLAECLYKADKFAEAESILKSLLQVDPGNFQAQQFLFTVLLRRGRFRTALRLLGEMARSDVVSELLKK